MISLTHLIKVLIVKSVLEIWTRLFEKKQKKFNHKFTNFIMTWWLIILHNHTWNKPGDPLIRSPTEIQFLRRRRANLSKNAQKIRAATVNCVKTPKNVGRRRTPQNGQPPPVHQRRHGLFPCMCIVFYRTWNLSQAQFKKKLEKIVFCMSLYGLPYLFFFRFQFCFFFLFWKAS